MTQTELLEHPGFDLMVWQMRQAGYSDQDIADHIHTMIRLDQRPQLPLLNE